MTKYRIAAPCVDTLPAGRPYTTVGAATQNGVARDLVNYKKQKDLRSISNRQNNGEYQK